MKSFRIFLKEDLYRYRHDAIIDSDVVEWSKINKINIIKDKKDPDIFYGVMKGKKDPIFLYDREMMHLYTDFTPLDFKNKRIDRLAK